MDGDGAGKSFGLFNFIPIYIDANGDFGLFNLIAIFVDENFGLFSLIAIFVDEKFGDAKSFDEFVTFELFNLCMAVITTGSGRRAANQRAGRRERDGQEPVRGNRRSRR